MTHGETLEISGGINNLPGTDREKEVPRGNPLICYTMRLSYRIDPDDVTLTLALALALTPIPEGSLSHSSGVLKISCISVGSHQAAKAIQAAPGSRLSKPTVYAAAAAAAVAMAL